MVKSTYETAAEIAAERKKTHDDWVELRRASVAFWDAHRVPEYDPKNPKWTVSFFHITKEEILEWYSKQPKTSQDN